MEVMDPVTLQISGTAGHAVFVNGQLYGSGVSGREAPDPGEAGLIRNDPRPGILWVGSTKCAGGRLVQPTRGPLMRLVGQLNPNCSSGAGQATLSED